MSLGAGALAASAGVARSASSARNARAWNDLGVTAARSSGVVAPDGVGLEARFLDLDVHRAELLVGLVVLRLVDEQVLAAQLLLDRLVDRRELLRAVDEEAATAGVLGELLEHLPGVVLEVLAQADRVDRHSRPPREVLRVLHLVLARLVLCVWQ